MDEIRKELAEMRIGMENSVKRTMDESIKGINDKLDSIMERTVTTEQLNERLNPFEQRMIEMVRVSEEMQQRIKDLEDEVVRQNHNVKITDMSKVLREQRTRIFIGRIKVRNQIKARQMVARVIEDVIQQEEICPATAFLFDIRQITEEACIITAATPAAAKDMLIGMRRNNTVVNEKWRVVPAVPNAQEVKQTVMAVDAILGKLKTMKVVKGWFTSYGVERGVYRVYVTVRRSDSEREVKLNLKTDIYKNKDSRVDMMNRVADNMLEVTTINILKDCVKEIVEGRAAGAQRRAESGAMGRPQEPLQMDTTNNGSLPPPTPKESTPIASPPWEGVINADYPPLPVKGSTGSPSLGLIKVARTGEKTKTEVRHHQTMLSVSTEEGMDGSVDMEMEKQTDKNKVLQMVKDGNKRGAAALDKSMDSGETAETEGRKPPAAKKSLLSKIV